jgi:hypothetical protein
MAATAFDRFCLSGYDVVTLSTSVLHLCGKSNKLGAKGKESAWQGGKGVRHGDGFLLTTGGDDG